MLQGFPVRITHSLGRAACSFAIRHQYDNASNSERIALQELYGPTTASSLKIKPTRAHIFKMAGNSMHTNISGIVWLFALTQIRVDGALLMMLKHHMMLKRHPRQIKSSLR